MSTVLKLRVYLGRLYLRGLDHATALVRGIAPQESRAGMMLRRIKRVLQGKPKRRLEVLLAAYARCNPEATFIQIGANDGVLEDPLRPLVQRYGWQGVLVEPVKYLFDRLRQNYGTQSGLWFENSAIAAREGLRDFYYLSENAVRDGLPEWSTGLGSLSKEVILSHAKHYPNMNKWLVTDRVPCITFESLCRKHHIKDVDVIGIDAEGHDYEIVKMIDFTRYRPAILFYEHHHMSAAERESCRVELSRHGYEFLEEGLDNLCLNVPALSPTDAHVLSVWRTLQSISVIPL